ncbi:DUF2147 domain-containing protein [Xanthobacter versatilis]|uniref:DUF2147 domain-containing protein n=1 Tax=Xanthobacter autotrophicus (strain ATCC BAA-1158 / Py2) TaxID=78245 RepID=UPI00372A2255
MRNLMAGLRALALIGPAMASPAFAAPDVTGTWMTEDGEGAVQIAPCGDRLCGRIVWLKTPLDENGQPMRDENNADLSQRDRPLCGMEVLSGVAPGRDGWEGGWIYDPEAGARYSVAIAPGEEDAIVVTGFVGMKAFGRTLQWHRAPASLKRCDAPPAPAKASAGNKRS